MKRNPLFLSVAAVYIIVVLGFILHTSTHPAIFGKYTVKYFLAVLAMLLLAKYAINTLVALLRNKKNFFFYFLILCLFLELFLRAINYKVLSQPYFLYQENFHPFLQVRMSEINNKDNPNLNINSFGFRYGKMQKNKSEGTFRVFVMGGSTVFNSTISYEQTYEFLLEKKLKGLYKDKKIEVINAGVDGYTSEHVLIQYETYIKDFKPDLIIVIGGINDMNYSCTTPYVTNGDYVSDYSNTLGTTAKMVQTYFHPIKNININSYLLSVISNIVSSNLYSDLKPMLGRIVKNNKKYIKISSFPSLDSYARNLNYFAEVVRNDGIELVMVNQPYLYSESNNSKVDWYMQRICTIKGSYPDLKSLIRGLKSFNHVTETISKDKQVNFLDLESQIPKTTEYFTDDVHFTEKGNQKVADVLLNYVKDNSLIKQ